MPQKKRTPSNGSSKASPEKPPSKSATPVPDIPPTSPITPSKQSPKKHVKIHPELQVETYVVGEPMQRHDEGNGKSGKPVGGSGGGSPTKDSPSQQQPQRKVVKQESLIETVIIDDKAKSQNTSESAVKSAPMAGAAASKASKAKKQPAKTKETHPKYYRDEATIRADNEALEGEISKYLFIGSRIWNGNTLIIVPEKTDTVNFDSIIDYCKANPNKKRSEVFATHGARPNADALIRIARNEPLDCLLIYHVAKTVTVQDKTRYDFFKELIEEKCIITIETGHKEPKVERIVRVVVPFEKLCALAERVSLKMPLKKAQITKYIKEFDKKQVTPQSQALSLFFHTYKYAKLCKEKRSAPFERSKIKDFEGGDFVDTEKLKSLFFSAAKRNYLVYNLIQSIQVTNTSAVPEAPFTVSNFRKEWYIDDLIVKKVFLECHALHGIEAPVLAKQASFNSLPTLLELHDYFGDDWGYYFAFAEFYKEFCFRMFLPGVIMIAWSVFRYSFPSANSAVSSSIFGSLAGILGVFDNASIPAYAFVMNIGGLLFLKFWKRRNNCLAFLWDSIDLPKMAKKERAAWVPSTQKEYSYVTGEMVPFETNASKSLRTLISSALLCLLFVVVVALGAVDVVIYAYVTNETVLGTNVQSSYGVPGAIGIVSIVACVHLLFVEWLLNLAVARIVKDENQRFEKKHRNRFITSQFILQFFNSFSFLLFMCLVRPMMAQSRTFNYYYGSLNCNAQGNSDTCLQELVLLVFVMFFIQQFLHLSLSTVAYIFRRVEARQNAKKAKTSFQICQKLDFLSEHSLARQYSDKLLQFGHLILFAGAFPLGPLLAILNNYIQVRLDIKRFLNQFKRKWAARKSFGLGLWEKWVALVVYLGIIVNGLAIPYISDGFYFISLYFYSNNYVAANYQYTQVGFFLVYVFVLSLCAGVIHFWIPDMPKQVDIGIQAEKFIAMKRKAAHDDE